MMKMWNRLLVLCILFVQPVTMNRVWDQKLHVALVQNVSKILRKTECWICTQVPAIDDENSEWPLIGILLNETNFGKSMMNFPGTWKPVTEAYYPVALSNVISNQDVVPCMIINATGEIILPPHCDKNNSKEEINPEIVAGMAQFPLRLIPPQGSGWYWICEKEAWKVLPLDKDRACALGAVIPNITILDPIDEQEWKKPYPKRAKRTSNPLIERPTIFHSIVRALVPSLGVSELEKAIVNISAVMENIQDHTLDAIETLKEQFQSLSRVVIQNRMALNFLLASQGGVCKVINTSCCSYIDQTGRINNDLVAIRNQTKILHQISLDDVSLGLGDVLHKLTSWLPNWTWMRQLFILVLYILSVSVIAHCMHRCYSCCRCR
ncbi:syncytin-A-like [Chiroxiphia lanceolata]|uniref:syncytin-A-like n=1 Tax=Chiroxiphia lanceolata TaxID=296741 RepID=UPI0013CED326|nr:syncytin-A-like [Chiroxiphia lanceolata]XP_032530466.1 syncytin-A-like [Chiroxiphia lanceolata]